MNDSRCPRRLIRIPAFFAFAFAISLFAAGSARAETKDDGASREGRAHDAVRVGAFGGVGFPRPLSIEAMVLFDELVGVGAEYSVMPSLTVSGVDATFHAWDVDARVFPFRNGFFLGLAAGRQHLGASTSIALPSSLGSIPAEVTADTWFINPRIGFLTTLKWGLTLGIDAGVQIPVSVDITNTIPSELAAREQANGIARTFGDSVLPTIDLFRLGLMF
jgi:hypothetical protein